MNRILLYAFFPRLLCSNYVCKMPPCCREHLYLVFFKGWNILLREPSTTGGPLYCGWAFGLFPVGSWREESCWGRARRGLWWTKLSVLQVHGRGGTIVSTGQTHVCFSGCFPVVPCSSYTSSHPSAEEPAAAPLPSSSCYGRALTALTLEGHADKGSDTSLTSEFPSPGGWEAAFPAALGEPGVGD